MCSTVPPSVVHRGLSAKNGPQSPSKNSIGVGLTYGIRKNEKKTLHLICPSPSHGGGGTKKPNMILEKKVLFLVRLDISLTILIGF